MTPKQLALHEASEKELEQALERKRQLKFDPEPAFSCPNCGEKGYFVGSFSVIAFERQKHNFDWQHRDCLPIIDGGCI